MTERMYEMQPPSFVRHSWSASVFSLSLSSYQFPRLSACMLQEEEPHFPTRFSRCSRCENLLLVCNPCGFQLGSYTVSTLEALGEPCSSPGKKGPSKNLKPWSWFAFQPDSDLHIRFRTHALLNIMSLEGLENHLGSVSWY